MAGVSCLAFFFDVSAAFESIGTDRVPIFDRPVSGRETLSQLVFVLALHFVQHLDGSPPGHGQPVQTHCCSLLQPQRWPTSAHVMSRPGSDDSPGSSPLAAPAAASEDAHHVIRGFSPGPRRLLGRRGSQLALRTHRSTIHPQAPGWEEGL